MRNQLSGKFNRLQRFSLVLRGSQRKYAKLYQELSCNSREAELALCCSPLQAEFDLIFEDILTPRMVFPELEDDFPALYALKITDGKGTFFCRPMQRRDWRITAQQLSEQLKQARSMIVRPSSTLCLEKGRLLCWDGKTFRMDGVETAERELIRFLDGLPEDTAVLQGPEKAADGEYPVLHLSVLNSGESGPQIIREQMFDHGSDGGFSIYSKKKSRIALADDDPRREAARNMAVRFGKRFREIEYFGVYVSVEDAGVHLMQISTSIDLALCCEDSEEIRAFVRRKASENRMTVKKQYRRLRSFLFSSLAQRKGFVNFMYRNWLRGLREDSKVKITTGTEKRWAHRRGFYSYRIAQYGLTEENYRDFLSDYTYKRLRPLNNVYRKWFWDKILTYYVLHPFAEYLPRHFYRIAADHGVCRVIPFDGDGIYTLEAILRLLKEQKTLALKKAVGSHGAGFHKLAWDAEGERFYIDDCPCTERELLELFRSLKGEYFISEYVYMHEDLRKIYDRVACTVRFMTIRDHSAAFIKTAYLRIGTSLTGNTDNLASGGVVAALDLESGEILTAEMLCGHVFTPCAVHPDSKTPIAGKLPYWAEIKAKIEEICRYICPLEYLGFDIVITDEGFKILEINTHQDLHKYPTYPSAVKEFFNQKMEQRGFVEK